MTNVNKHLSVKVTYKLKTIHENLRYSCDQCEKTFDQQGNLQRHIKSDHEKTLYHCDKCEQAFVYQGDLQRHLKTTVRL